MALEKADLEEEIDDFPTSSSWSREPGSLRVRQVGARLDESILELPRIPPVPLASSSSVIASSLNNNNIQSYHKKQHSQPDLSSLPLHYHHRPNHDNDIELHSNKKVRQLPKEKKKIVLENIILEIQLVVLVLIQMVIY